MKVLEKPYTIKEIKKKMNQNGYISGNIAVPLRDIIHTDYEGFLDILGMKLVGSICLGDISYSVAGHTDDNQVIIRVTGDALTLPDFEEN